MYIDTYICIYIYIYNYVHIQKPYVFIVQSNIIHIV